MRRIMAIDQGTSSSRAMVFDLDGRILGIGQEAFDMIFPADGWVEQDPEVLWQTTLAAGRAALAAAGLEAADIAAIGITNQRETTLVWDRRTGECVHNAIVWQDRRTADHCERMRADGIEELVARETGLVLDPYFSATKLAWLLDEVPGLRQRAEQGELCFGTVDSFLIWRLTGGLHATDATNASPSSSTSAASAGAPRCSTTFASPSRCCRKCATVRRHSGAPRRAGSARKYPSSVWPATSRQPWWVRAASAPA